MTDTATPPNEAVTKTLREFQQVTADLQADRNELAAMVQHSKARWLGRLAMGTARDWDVENADIDELVRLERRLALLDEAIAQHTLIREDAEKADAQRIRDGIQAVPRPTRPTPDEGDDDGAPAA
jgi:hypothetical protein